MRLPYRLQGQKVKSQDGAGAYCGGDLAVQLVSDVIHDVIDKHVCVWRISLSRQSDSFGNDWLRLLQPIEWTYSTTF